MEKNSFNPATALAQARQAYHSNHDEVTPYIKNLLEEMFGKSNLQAPVTERIKTFNDALNALGYNHVLVKQYIAIRDMMTKEGTISDKESCDIVSYLACRIICAALNEGWENPQDCKTTVYYVWYYLYDHKPTKGELCSDEVPTDVDMSLYGLPAGLAFSYSYYAPSGTSANIGSRLCFKTRDLAIYAAKQFADIFLDFLLIRK